MKKNILNKKLISLSLAYLLFFLSTFFHLRSNDFDDFNFNFDDVSLDDLSKIETRAGNDELSDNIILMTGSISEPLWKTTKPPKGRDVLYLLPHKLTAIEYGGFVINLFFNYTNKMNFSPNETLKLTENEDAFQRVILEYAKLTNEKNASAVMPLFKKLTIQERKAGALFQAGFITGSFTFQLNTSLQISERNFWLNKQDREQIKSLFEDTGNTFSEKELYLIKYGLGDTRIKAGINTLNTSSVQLDLGIEIIIPTSKVSNLTEWKDHNINFKNIKHSMTEMIFGIRDNLIEPRLGNNGHYGLGCYVESKTSLFHDLIHLWNRISFDNLFSAKEDRLIPSKQTMIAPAKHPNTALYLNEINADEEKQTNLIKQYIFPPPYRVTIKPGGIMNFISTATFNLNKKWSIGIGYDFYYQQQECIDVIHNLEDEINTLRLEDAEIESSQQHKFFTEANYIKKQRGWDLNLGLGGDYTISAKRIGHDWTIFLRLGASF